MRIGKYEGLLVALFLTLITVSIPVMGSIEPSSSELTLAAGASTTEYRNVTITELPEMADVLFSTDLSLSMEYLLGNLKYFAALPNTMTGLDATGIDMAYGLSSHSDYPAYYTWPCGYSAHYGESFDFEYALNQPITADQSAVISAFQGLTVYDGWDNAEDYSRVFYESYSDPATGWRFGAKKVMVHIGDWSYPHDCNLNEGIPGKVGTWNTGGDPGRDGVADTDDDLDFQTVLHDMGQNNITLIKCQVNPDYTEYWTVWTGITGGHDLMTGEQSFGQDVARVITEELTTYYVTNAHIVAEPGYEIWVDSPWSYTGPAPSVPFSDIPVTFTVPAGTPVGTHTFTIYVVDDAGVSYGAQSVTVHVVTPSTVTVTHIVPASGSNTGSVSIKNLGGTGFAEGADVRLTRFGYDDIIATGVSVESAGNKITCTFDLTGAQTGLWNVTVTNTDGGSGTLVNGFTVTNGNTKVRK